MENKNNSWFAKTQDKNTANELIESGFQLVDYANGIWTFMNKPDCKLTFDKNKITYSNILHI